MSRFSNENFSVGSKQYESNKRVAEHQRQSVIKAGNSNLPHSQAISSARENFLKKQEEAKRMRAMFKKIKGSAIHKALNNHK